MGAKGTYNLQNLRNEWTTFKQYTLNEEYHVVSLIPREYLNTFQGNLDSLSNTPLEPTELEKADTLLARVDSVRYQVAISTLVYYHLIVLPHLTTSRTI